MVRGDPASDGEVAGTLLVPDIVSAILGGKHPPELTTRKLMDDTRLPLDWNEQRRSLEFAYALPKLKSASPTQVPTDLFSFLSSSR